MTREEAIKWLIKPARTSTDIGEIKEKEIEAYDMAIEALSQPIVAKHFDIQSGYIYCSPQIAENVKVVVRCKDCRHSRVYQTDSKGTMQTYCVAFIMSRTVTDDDFCSWGERKEP